MTKEAIIPVGWMEFTPPRIMSDMDWMRFVAMMGEKEFVILNSNDGEDVQGYWVQHKIAISQSGMDNLRRCSDILGYLPAHFH